MLFVRVSVCLDAWMTDSLCFVYVCISMYVGNNGRRTSLYASMYGWDAFSFGCLCVVTSEDKQEVTYICTYTCMYACLHGCVCVCMCRSSHRQVHMCLYMGVDR